MSILTVFAIILGLIGIIGAVVPGIPGPPLSWIGLMLTYLAGGLHDGSPLSLTVLFVWLAITVIVTIMDYVVPAYFTKMTGGTKVAATGAIVGLFAGLFIPPVGMILGSLLGAFLADFLIEDRGVWAAFKSSVGAFLGFLCGTGFKLIASGVMLYYIIAYI